ncbi:MAG: ATP-binding cassette domain-containing protein [Pseudomonadota bacterium]
MSALDIDIRAKWFDGEQVLGHVQAEVPLGQRVALLGPSGIGKSTLLALISGTDKTFEGSVQRPSGRLAMIFQTPRLLPWRTLVQNIILVPGAEDESKARALLADVGLENASDSHPEKVSLGMQRRAAIARAMAVSPSTLLMDEPLVSLDPEAAVEMRRLLVKAMDRTAATAMFATHDRFEALTLADRVLELGGSPARIIRDRVSPLARSERTAEPVSALVEEWFGA